MVARLAKALKSEADPDATKEPEETIELEEQEKTETQASEDVYDITENEIDMADVTIIDEYDSTKSEDKVEDPEKQVSQSGTEKKEPRRLDDKEKRLWTKRFTLPDNPTIVVHPSRTAKSGKFDCISMSLSLLLDYRQEDTKEHSFEVSLFAEMFNEMLMRDFGFNIYKALVTLPDPVVKTKEKDEKKQDEKKDDESKEKPKESDSKKQEEKDEKDKDKKSSRAGSRDRKARSRSRDKKR